MKRTRVKICGITRSQDALAAVSAGADAIGLVFWEGSPRAVTLEQAERICSKLPVFVSVVALTVNADKNFIEQITRSLPLSLLQFHGDESPDYCDSFDRPFVKAVRMRPGLDLSAEINRFQNAQGVLLDAYREGIPGGTGESFDWSLIPESFRNRIVLAGGLNCGNIEKAIRTIQPYAVDVSGGVELSKGIKDHQRIDRFIANVNKADQVEQY